MLIGQPRGSSGVTESENTAARCGDERITETVRSENLDHAIDSVPCPLHRDQSLLRGDRSGPFDCAHLVERAGIRRLRVRRGSGRKMERAESRQKIPRLA
jgi:hypothetical protein